MLVRCSENFKAVLRVKKEWIEVFIKKKPLVNFEFTRVECGRWDLNPHGIAATRSLVLLVCQFRHFRLTYVTNDILPCLRL